MYNGPRTWTGGITRKIVERRKQSYGQTKQSDSIIILSAPILAGNVLAVEADVKPAKESILVLWYMVPLYPRKVQGTHIETGAREIGWEGSIWTSKDCYTRNEYTLHGWLPFSWQFGGSACNGCDAVSAARSRSRKRNLSVYIKRLESARGNY